MKAVKGFVKTCYSEGLVSASGVAENEREDGSLITDTKEGSPPPEIEFHGGLGLQFKFPGDPKKLILPMSASFLALTCYRLREASKIKLWTTYLKSTPRSAS
jgi:hypothetical protein